MSSPYDLSGGAMSQAQSDAMMAAYQRQADANAQQLAQQYKLGKADIDARLKIAAQSSKDSRYNVDAQRDTERERIEQARQEMLNIGIPQVEINRFVAEANKALAESELSLKRDIFLADTQQKQAQLQLDREQMERVGIPQMEINRYIAEKSAELDRLTFGEGQRQFNATASGYMSAPGQLQPEQQARMNQLQAQDAALRAAGPPGTPGLQGAELQELQGYQQTLAAGGGQQATLAREQFWQDQQEQNRRYGLDVAQWGAELGAQPDRYFQARRAQGVDIPRLMGGAGAATSGPTGVPTPGIATMGARLAGQDPYATPYGGSSAGAGQPAAPGTLGLPGTPEDDRAKQVAKIAALSPPSPYDGLDSSDSATLKLMEEIYKKGGQSIAGGEYERLAASGRLGYLQSAGTVLGYDPAELASQYASYRPVQGQANLAG